MNLDPIVDAGLRFGWRCETGRAWSKQATNSPWVRNQNLSQAARQ